MIHAVETVFGVGRMSAATTATGTVTACNASGRGSAGIRGTATASVKSRLQELHQRLSLKSNDEMRDKVTGKR